MIPERPIENAGALDAAAAIFPNMEDEAEPNHPKVCSGQVDAYLLDVRVHALTNFEATQEQENSAKLGVGIACLQTLLAT